MTYFLEASDDTFSPPANINFVIKINFFHVTLSGKQNSYMSLLQLNHSLDSNTRLIILRRASGVEVIVAEEAGAAVAVAEEAIQAPVVVGVVEVVAAVNKTPQISKRPSE